MRVGEKVNDVAVQPDGLMFIATDAGVIKVDKSGNDVNIFESVDASSIELLPDGDLLLASWKLGKILQISQAGEKRWELSVGASVHVLRNLDGEYFVAGSSGFTHYDSKRKLKQRHTHSTNN